MLPHLKDARHEQSDSVRFYKVAFLRSAAHDSIKVHHQESTVLSQVYMFYCLHAVPCGIQQGCFRKPSTKKTLHGRRNKHPDHCKAHCCTCQSTRNRNLNPATLHRTALSRAGSGSPKRRRSYKGVQTWQTSWSLQGRLRLPWPTCTAVTCCMVT